MLKGGLVGRTRLNTEGKSLVRISRWLGLAGAAVGVLVLLGWALDIGPLKSVIPGQVAMKPNTAVGIILLGVALSLVTDTRAVAARLSTGSSLLAGAVGAATLAEYWTDRNFGIDQLLFHEAPGAVGTVVPGRMAVPTALCLVLLGIALLIVKRDRWIVTAQVLTSLAFVVALFDLIAVASGAKGATAENPFTLPAINTSVALLAIAIGALLARAYRGLMAVATADTAGARLIRRVVPTTAALLLTLQVANDLAQEAGLYGHDVGVAVNATLGIVALVVVLWIVAAPMNVRELKQRADDAQLRSILDAAADAILAVDGSGTILACNPRAEEMFGYVADELDGRNVDELVPEWLAEGHPKLRTRFMEGGFGERMDVEVTGRRKDGSEFPGELTLAKVDLPGGPQATAILRDVTVRREAERALRESEERFRTLVEQIPGVALIEVEDPEQRSGFREEFVSPQVFDFFGYTQDEWVAANEVWLTIAHPDDRPALLAESERTVATGEPFRMEYRALTRAGDIRWIHEESIRTGSEGNYRWRGLMTDISDRKRLEEAVRETEAAIRASEMKSEFLSRMSHELRTPLNAILGFTQLVAMDAADEATRESTDHILRAGKHLLELVDEVLGITQAERRLPLEAVALLEVAGEAIEAARGEAAARGISINATGDAGLHAKADRAALGRALDDLVSNAVRFNHEGGEVEVSVSQLPERRVRIDVRDTGEGIPANKMRRLFSPFDRLDAEKRGVEGTGLGLTLAKALVESMGGAVSVTSAEGNGSTFSIELDMV